MKNIELKGEQDFTKELREAVSLKVDELHFTTGQENPIWATGKLEGEDFRGHHGILRIEGENRPQKISGKSKEDRTVIYTKAPAVPELDIDGDHIGDSAFSSATMSQRKYLRVEADVDGFEAENIIFRGDNNKSVFKPGFPEYESNFEFEHGIQNTGSNSTFKNIHSEFIRGDGFYANGGKNVNVIDCSVNWCGRQGGAVVAGENYFIKNYNCFGVRRSDFDIEANNTFAVVNNVFLIGGTSNAYLSGVPMGGKGQVTNILIRDRDFQWGNLISILGSHSRGYLREKIIIDGIKMRAAFKSASAPLRIEDASDVLIENIFDCLLHPTRSNVLFSLRGACKNIVIRNCDFENAKYIKLEDDTKPENVIVYDVKQDLEFLYLDGTTEPVIQKIATEKEKKELPFEVSTELYGRYYRDYEQDEKDTEAPNFDKFENIYIEVEYGVKGQVVEVNPTATDNSGDPVKIEQIRGIKSGQIFPIGIHELIFRATDSSGNSIDKSIIVTIHERAYIDTIPPEFETIEDATFYLEHDQESMTIVWNEPKATDNIDADVEIVQAMGLPSGSLFDEGVYNILYKAIDKSGNSTEVEFKIIVNRLEAPIEPDKPIETDEEALDMAQKILDFLKKSLA